MTNRLLREATYPFDESIKLEMRKLFRQGLGLPPNASEIRIAQAIGVSPRYLYRYLAQDYNNYVRAENERILAERRQRAEQRRQERLRQQREERLFNNLLNTIPSRIITTFTGLNKAKVTRILRRLIE